MFYSHREEEAEEESRKRWRGAEPALVRVRVRASRLLLCHSHFLKPLERGRPIHEAVPEQ